MLDKETKEIILKKLEELFFEQFYKDKKNRKQTYVKLSQCYLDLKKFFEKNL